MEKGDIFKLKNRKRGYYFHPFVFWEDIDEQKFRGVMLTSTDTMYSNNVDMAPSHFSTDFNFGYDNSQFVMAKLVKDAPKEKMKKVGELTEEGIEFVAEHVDGLPDSTWNEIKAEGVIG